jgi:hypothetical protein
MVFDIGSIGYCISDMIISATTSTPGTYTLSSSVNEIDPEDTSSKVRFITRGLVYCFSKDVNKGWNFICLSQDCRIKDFYYWTEFFSSRFLCK